MTLCPSPLSISREQRPALGIQLAHDVVEQHERDRSARRRERLALGEQQRQQREPLLALRAVRAQLAAAAQQAEVVAVRPVAGEAALEVRRRVLGELGGEARCVGRTRPRLVAQLATLAEPQRLGDRGEARGEQVDRGGAVVAQGDAMAGELGVPRRQRARRRATAAHARQQGVALCERLAVGASRRRAPRPHRRDDLIDVRAPQRRRALHELEAVRAGRRR